MKTLCALLILVLPLAPRAAQTQDIGAKMIDQFGDIQVSDYLARLDNFAIELQNNPSATGYVVAYIVPNNFPGWPLRRANWARGYLVRGRGIEEGRVEVFNGGYRDSVAFEFWMVAPGGKLPVAPFDYGAELSREKGAYLFDRYSYFDLDPDDTGIESGYIGYLDEKGRHASYVEALRLDPAARGCVIAYRTRRGRRGSDRALAAHVKLSILKHHALAADRVVAVGGGVRERQVVEYWIVPPGAPLPRPTPEPTPARRRRRR